MKSITAAEANGQFSPVLRTLARRETGPSTARGKPVTPIALAHLGATPAGSEQARPALLEDLRRARPTKVPRGSTRDELCER